MSLYIKHSKIKNKNRTKKKNSSCLFRAEIVTHVGYDSCAYIVLCWVVCVCVFFFFSSDIWNSYNESKMLKIKRRHQQLKTIRNRNWNRKIYKKKKEKWHSKFEIRVCEKCPIQNSNVITKQNFLFFFSFVEWQLIRVLHGKMKNVFFFRYCWFVV